MEGKQKERPEIGKFLGFDHITLYVGNALQASSFYVSRLGFEPYAYEGLETGSRERVTHVVRNGKVTIALTSPLNWETEFGKEHAAHCAKHGDGVKEVAFGVENCEHTFNVSKSRGAKVVREPYTIEDKDGGSVTMATICTYGDTVITFVERNNFKGTFLPNFIAKKEDPISKLIDQPQFGFIDHIVGNHKVGDMEVNVQWFEKILDFHRFWSIDDSVIHTEYSSLKSIVVCDYDETVKMPQNEPANGKRKSQIQEYVDYYNGSGVQHVAINVDNVIDVVDNLGRRGTQFLNIPDKYYENLKKRLEAAGVTIKEDIDVLKKHKILVDFDENGYILQIFTKNVEDRPTLFFEFIQRNNHNGFGAGNFKSLFEAIEREQEKRGNL